MVERRERGKEHLSGDRRDVEDQQLGDPRRDRVEAELHDAEHAPDHEVVELARNAAITPMPVT